MQNKDDENYFCFTDLKSVYIHFEIEIKSFLFFLANSLSILLISFILNFNLLNAILIIVMVNRLWLRADGFHASNLWNCYIITNILFSISIWLSGVIVINPIITLICCAIFMYDRLEQAYLLAVILLVSFLKIEFAYLSTVLCISLFLAYITNGEGINGRIMRSIDSLLCKLTDKTERNDNV